MRFGVESPAGLLFKSLNPNPKGLSMKSDSIELLEASAVLELASAMRKDAWETAKIDSKDLKGWRDAHPVSEFVPKAVGMLDGVAEQVRRIRASSRV